MQNSYVLQCSNLHKRFKEGELYANVLRGVELTIQPGEQVAIIGNSGSGKSTLLHLLGGLDKPTEGEVKVMGKVINQLSPAQQSVWRNRHLGFIYQFHHLLPEFTALENVSIPLLIRGVASQDALQRAAELLTQVGLGHRLKHKPGELSGGERQRTAVARALVTQPCCILADEPTGNLDQHTARQVYETMVTLNQEIKTSLLLVTHDSTLAKRMQRTLRLVEGVLVEE